MNLFIDDAGSFSWHAPGTSLFAGLTVPDREMNGLLDRFDRWRRSIIGSSRRELKGNELTLNQLYSFTHKVLPVKGRDTRVTVVGADTSETSENVVALVRDQVSAQFKASADLVRRTNPANKTLIQNYVELSGWVRNRSTPNFLWISALEDALLDTFQHSAVCYMEPEYDPEFENTEIVIDRSFIHREQHVYFWKGWLAHGMNGRARRAGSFMVPDTWASRGHPFQRKYGGQGTFDFNDLFMNHMRFGDSQKVPGLQIADICAHICYRHWRGDEASGAAYCYLRPRIVGRNAIQIRVIHLTAEQSVIHDAIENHVGIADYESIRRRGAELQGVRRAGRGSIAGPSTPPLRLRSG
ncbi:MAG: DUF3800 domain-containing protein [Candidatus Sulfotelmatobacter sp.]